MDKADLGLKKQILLDGLPGSGKSVVLAMLVQWARSKGWLVCYIPSGRKWTHDGLYYKNQFSGLWDTPVQAASMLQVNSSNLFLPSFMRKACILVKSQEC